MFNKRKKAFLQRERLDLSVIPYQSGGRLTDDYILEKRWKNHLKYDKGNFKVYEVVEVEISETDTKDKVITLKSIDGQVCSLWLSGNNVRSLTTY